ncbi:MAG: 3-methyladenine DNA glycosylase [Epsilonproteobacteria bacterium]|nr:3-methyladenine DNA glycosylase [Campylobacterota bacterium]
MDNSYELLMKLRELNLLQNKPKHWWPNYGTFEVVVGAILTQNTKWENVEKALFQLKMKSEKLKVEDIASFDYQYLSEIIKPAGFYNQKAKRLIILSKNILKDFGSFEEFKESVDREWLLAQKGVGFETADSILCYACGREIMVVDAYTKRLLKNFGYEFESYDELREWCERGVYENWNKLKNVYEDKNLAFARFHGKIVEFMKRGLLKQTQL